MPDPAVQTPQEAQLAQLIVRTLNLEMTADEIDPLAPLFGEGLGLDSIDVLELALHFARIYSQGNGLPLRPLSAEARRQLVVNRWPGNVRELENTIHRAVLLASGPEIGAEAILAPDGGRLDDPRHVSPAVAHAAFAAEQVTRALVGRTVADVERDLILETLKHCLGNRTHAANILGISIRTLRNKLNEYSADGVPIPPPGGGEIRSVA